jgi:prepilin-type N-terminal cleavage/methylation domain-containing protein
MGSASRLTGRPFELPELELPAMCSPSLSRRSRGFTVVELLVVIAIVGMLLGVLLPAVHSARESGRRIACGNNLRQIGLGLLQYEQAWKILPTSMTRNLTGRRPWSIGVLPYWEQSALYKQYNNSLEWPDPANQPVVSQRLALLECPSSIDDRMDQGLVPMQGAATYLTAVGDYAPVEGVDARLVAQKLVDFASYGAMARDWGGAPRFAQIRDGMSNTILVGECVARPTRYAAGRADTSRYIPGAGWGDHRTGFTLHGADPVSGSVLNLPFSCAINCTNEDEAFSFHPSAAGFVFADGSTHFLSASMDIRILARLITADMGEGIPANQF